MKPNSDYKQEDFVRAFTGYEFALFILSLLTLLQVVGLHVFYLKAVPLGFSGNPNFAQLEALIFACAIMGLVVKILSHQNSREKYDALTFVTVALIFVPNVFLLFDIPFKPFMMRLFVLGEFGFAIFIVILFLSLHHD